MSEKNPGHDRTVPQIYWNLEITIPTLLTFGYIYISILGLMGLYFQYARYEIIIFPYLNTSEYFSQGFAIRPLVATVLIFIIITLLGLFVVWLRAKGLLKGIRMPESLKKFVGVETQEDKLAQFWNTFKGKNGLLLFATALLLSVLLTIAWEERWPTVYRAEITTSSGEVLVGKLAGTTSEYIFFIEGDQREKDVKVTILAQSDVVRIDILSSGPPSMGKPVDDVPEDEASVDGDRSSQ